VTLETPRRYTGVVQCTRCQQYGHSKTYCNKPFVCVKCGAKHSTADCKKPRDTPATCALCNGPHTANYKGCEFYHHLLRVKGNYNNRFNLHSTAQIPSLPTTTPTTTSPIKCQTQSSADIVKGKHTADTDEYNHQRNMLSTFLTEFKTMFHQLLQQNNMVINMLTMLISKK